MQNETTATISLNLIKDIPEEEFISGRYYNNSSPIMSNKFCVLGHINRLKYGFTENGTIFSGSKFETKLRKDSKEFMEKVHHKIDEIANVNDRPTNEYPQKEIKNRVIALLTDMINRGF